MSEELKPFQKVLVRDYEVEKWVCTFFSHIHKNENGEIEYICINDNPWNYCLPFNDETIHLLGTTDSPTPPEPEFKWGDKVEVKDIEDEMWHLGIFMDKHDGRFYAIVNKTAGSLPWKYCRHADW